MIAEEVLVMITARNQATATIRQVARSLDPDLASAARSVGLAMAAMGVAASSMGIKFNIMQQEGHIALAALSQDADFAKKAMAEFVDISKNTRFSVGELKDAAQHMLAMGFNTKQVLPAMKALLDFSSAFGAEGTSIMNRLTYAMGQIAAKGTLVSEEMRQLKNAMVPVDELAKALDMTGAEFEKAVEGKMIPSGKALAAIMTLLENRTGGLSETMAQTLPGSWDRFVHKVQESLGNALEPTFIALTKMMSNLNDQFPEIEKSAGIMASGVKTAFGTVGASISIVSGMATQLGQHIANVVSKSGTAFGTLGDLASVIGESLRDKLNPFQEDPRPGAIDRAKSAVTKAFSDLHSLDTAFEFKPVDNFFDQFAAAFEPSANPNAVAAVRRSGINWNEIFTGGVTGDDGKGTKGPKIPEKLSLDSFLREFDFAKADETLNNEGRSLMKSLVEGIQEGGTSMIENIARNAAKIEMVLKEGLNPALASSTGTRFMGALKHAVSDQGSESIDALRNILTDMAQELAMSEIGNKLNEAVNKIRGDAAKQIDDVNKKRDKSISQLEDELKLTREIRAVTEAFDTAQEAALKAFIDQQSAASKARDIAKEEVDLRAGASKSMAQYLASVTDSGRVDAKEIQRHISAIRRQYFFDRQEMVRKRAQRSEDDLFERSQVRALEEFKKQQARSRTLFTDVLADQALQRDIKRIRDDAAEQVKQIEILRDKRILEETNIANDALLKQKALLANTWLEYQELFANIFGTDLSVDSKLIISAYGYAAGLLDPTDTLAIQAWAYANELPDPTDTLAIKEWAYINGLPDPTDALAINEWKLQTGLAAPLTAATISGWLKAGGLGNPDGSYDVNNFNEGVWPGGSYDVNYWNRLNTPQGWYNVDFFNKLGVPQGWYNVDFFNKFVYPGGSYNVDWFNDFASDPAGPYNVDDFREQDIPEGPYEITDFDGLSAGAMGVSAMGSQANSQGNVIINVNMEGSVVYGLDDLDKKIAASIVRSIRQGGLRLQVINQRRGGNTTGSGGGVGASGLP